MTQTPRRKLFLARLDTLPEGYQEGAYAGDRWGVTVTGKRGDRVRKLYGERLAGGDAVSFNLYTTASGTQLKPCEMPEAKVVAFVIGFEPFDR